MSSESLDDHVDKRRKQPDQLHNKVVDRLTTSWCCFSAQFATSSGPRACLISLYSVSSRVDGKPREPRPLERSTPVKSSVVRSRGLYDAIDRRILQIDGDDCTRTSISSSVAAAAAGSSVIGASVTSRQPNSVTNDRNIASISALAGRGKTTTERHMHADRRRQRSKLRQSYRRLETNGRPQCSLSTADKNRCRSCVITTHAVDMVRKENIDHITTVLEISFGISS